MPSFDKKIYFPIIFQLVLTVYCVVPSIFNKVMSNHTEIGQLFSCYLACLFLPPWADCLYCQYIMLTFMEIWVGPPNYFEAVVVATKTRFFHVHIPWKICRSLIFLGCTLEARRNYSCILGTFFSFS